ncbi:MAG: TonB-dependent receptor family protein [Thalassotalea sp.]
MSSRTQVSLSLIASAVLSTLSFAAVADKPDDTEHLSIFGDRNPVNDVPGSAHMISKEELEKFDYSDIMRTLTSIPGVYVLEEDGYGLRPNVGMRGTGQNRSEKVTIMEDGVLAAPAAYSAPSAYYFPTAGRMEQVEVLKGTSSAMYGPRTTGGVVNMLSRQIPDAAVAGQVKLQAGEDGYGKLHAHVGGSGERVSSVVEVYRYQADGFKDIKNSDRETGFVKNDILAKVKINSDQDAKYYQELEVKVKYSDEDSDETYMGITSADFSADPYVRYSASQLDNMATEHKQLQLNHSIDLSPTLMLSSSAYYNDFHRNWYKTNKVGGESLGSGGIEAAAAFDNAASIDGLAVEIKANNRDYLSQGIQSFLYADLNDHQLTIGVRYHEDEMDRFQWVDEYLLDQSYQMIQTSAGVAGTDSNRVDSAEALAIFVHDEYTFGKLVVNAGLRYEDMTISRHDWGKADSARINNPSYKRNAVDVLLPSLAVTYRLNDDLLLVGGVQKGFAPPAPGNESSENEESVNYEFGARYNSEQLRAEALVFFSDYENMHGNCTASQGCNDDNIGNQYNAGAVEVKGLELKVAKELTAGGFAVPIDLTYTYTSTEFLNDFSSSLETWNDVVKGDALPYVPENQLQLSVAVVGEKWRGDAIIRYTDEMRTTAGQGQDVNGIDSRTVVDLAAHYSLTNQQKVSLNIDNLLDEEYVATKTHGSIMVGKPRTLTLGYSYSF